MAPKIKTALLSVTDKTGLTEFAAGLSGWGIELISTGGTAQTLRQAGLPVKDVAQVTGFPEMLDGRVKTLHPHIHGGILARRDLAAHLQQIARHNISAIDLVCVNLYMFRETVSAPSCTLEKAIESMDIGGPCLIRAAAKNHAHVTVVTDPADYSYLLQLLAENAGGIPLEVRRKLAAQAFRLTSLYDKGIADYLQTAF
jgi:phosphoribosylaminoimidazolecarboxamide formyltransferase/IMP cyclohydrolase